MNDVDKNLSKGSFDMYVIPGNCNIAQLAFTCPPTKINVLTNVFGSILESDIRAWMETGVYPTPTDEFMPLAIECNQPSGVTLTTPTSGRTVQIERIGQDLKVWVRFPHGSVSAARQLLLGIKQDLCPDGEPFSNDLEQIIATLDAMVSLAVLIDNACGRIQSLLPPIHPPVISAETQAANEAAQADLMREE